MRGVFVGILWAFGLFLISYRGYKKEDELIADNVLTNVAGVLTIIVALLPTLCGECQTCSSCNEHSLPWVRTVHLLSVGLFFILMGYMSFFNFTRSTLKLSTDDPNYEMKKRRSKLFRTAALVIWGCIAILALEFLLDFSLTSLDVFILETVALIAFGISWLAKGESLKVFKL